MTNQKIPKINNNNYYYGSKPQSSRPQVGKNREKKNEIENKNYVEPKKLK